MTDAVLVLGEALVDVVDTGDCLVVEHPGGSPANVAVALARLGLTVELATAFGTDRRGDALHDHLVAAGVRLVGEPRVLTETSVAVAHLDPAGAATYRFAIDGFLPTVTPAGHRRHLHTGSIAAMLAPGCTEIGRQLVAHAGHATISYDINARPDVTGTGVDLVRRVEAFASLSDLVKASDEDLATVYPDLSVDAAADRLLRLGPAAVVVTRGGDGASCHTSRGIVTVPGREVAVADTIGAGDAFAAGLIEGLARVGCLGAANREALRAAPPDVWRDLLAGANAAAAVAVARPGANPPTREELEVARTQAVSLR